MALNVLLRKRGSFKVQHCRGLLKGNKVYCESTLDLSGVLAYHWDGSIRVIVYMGKSGKFLTVQYCICYHNHPAFTSLGSIGYQEIAAK